MATVARTLNRAVDLHSHACVQDKVVYAIDTVVMLDKLGPVEQPVLKSPVK